MSEMEAVRRPLPNGALARAVRADPVRPTPNQPARPRTVWIDNRAHRPAPVRAHVLHGRPVPAPVAPGRLTRFNDWRKSHYVADQAMRVVLVLLLGALAVAVLLSIVVALISWALGKLSDGLAGAGVGGGALLLVLLVAAIASRRGGHKHSGHGWHYTKCR
jgi:hypothetical protein